MQEPKFKKWDYVKYAIRDEGGDGKVFERGHDVITGINSLGNYELMNSSLLAKESELELSAPTIKAFVSGKSEVEFDCYMDGNLYYTVDDQNTGFGYRFFVPIEETGHATFKSRDKAITFMRWIRQAMKNKTLVKL